MNATTINIPDITGASQTVSTMDALMADGGQVTIGSKADTSQTDATQSASLMAFLKGLVSATGQKADAKNSATDTTAISHTSILKQISASVQSMVLAAGSAIIGKVGIDQTTPGTTNGVQVNAALPAGTNIIGKVTTDQTTHGTTDLVAADITKVAGSAISQGHGTAAAAIRVELPTDGTGVVGLAAGSATIGNIGVVAGTAIMGKVGIDQTTPGTTDSVTVATGQGAGAAIGATSGAAVITDANGTIQQYLRGLIKQWIAGTLGIGVVAVTGGMTGANRIVSAANSTNATSAKASAGRLYHVRGYNAAAAVRYLKFYDKASAPSVGVDTPVLTIPLASSGIFDLSFDDIGYYFTTGIAYALTVNVADNDNTAVTAADILGLNVIYA